MTAGTCFETWCDRCGKPTDWYTAGGWAWCMNHPNVRLVKPCCWCGRARCCGACQRASRDQRATGDVTPTIRIASTEIDGLDLALGGGVRMLERVDGAGDCATVLVRGAAGTGKTILASHIAAALAKKLECDVAVACVELLPPELEAQLAGFEATRPLLPVRGDERAVGSAPRVFARVIEPDLTQKDDPIGDEVQRLLDSIERNGGAPRVLVVDSLSDGYGIGGKVERVAADALARLAAMRGVCLILTEETWQFEQSPWCFVVDTVIELRLEHVAACQRKERTVTVVKNRFGESDAAAREMSLEVGTLTVLPPSKSERAGA